ncbi:unnamed protein product, partial [Heterosigma akashiwo]
ARRGQPGPDAHPNRRFLWRQGGGAGRRPDRGVLGARDLQAGHRLAGGRLRQRGGRVHPR